MSKRKIAPLTSGEKELLKMLNCGESLDNMVKPLMKRLKSGISEIEISTPRDRNSTFEPTIIAKGQTAISEGICDKILSFYKSGMSYSDIQESLRDLYDTEISVGTISNAESQLLKLDDKWGKTYQIVLKSWHNKSHQPTKSCPIA